MGSDLSYESYESRIRRERREKLKRQYGRTGLPPGLNRSAADHLDKVIESVSNEEADRRRRIEINLVISDTAPVWINLVTAGGSPCGRSIETLIDGTGDGSCSRPPGHDGRHLAVAGASRRVIGLGPRREFQDGQVALFSRNGTRRYGAETKPKTVKDKALTSVAKVVKAAPKAPLPEPKVGQACPKHIKLDQRDGKRCPVYGRKLDDTMCSRPTGHKGDHIATDGDQPGAEVIAICSP